jgi:hypothetical protein
LFLRRWDVREYFFFCTHCGNAYRERPDPPDACNEIHALRDVAPDGIALPEAEETANLQGRVIAERNEFDDLMWHVEREYTQE